MYVECARRQPSEERRRCRSVALWQRRRGRSRASNALAGRSEAQYREFRRHPRPPPVTPCGTSIVAGAGPARCGCRVRAGAQRASGASCARRGRSEGAANSAKPCPGRPCGCLRSIGLPVPDRDGPHMPIGGNLSSWNAEQLHRQRFHRRSDGPGWRLDRRLLRRAAARRRGGTPAQAIARCGSPICDRHDADGRFSLNGRRHRDGQVDHRRHRPARDDGATAGREARARCPADRALCHERIRVRLSPQSNRDRGRSAGVVVRGTSAVGRGGRRLPHPS